MDLVGAIPIGMPSPLVGAVAHADVGWMALTIDPPLVGIGLCAGGRPVFGNEGVAGPRDHTPKCGTRPCPPG
jgi:hypothetical protein